MDDITRWVELRIPRTTILFCPPGAAPGMTSLARRRLTRCRLATLPDVVPLRPEPAWRVTSNMTTQSHQLFYTQVLCPLQVNISWCCNAKKRRSSQERVVKNYSFRKRCEKAQFPKEESTARKIKSTSITGHWWTTLWQKRAFVDERSVQQKYKLAVELREISVYSLLVNWISNCTQIILVKTK